MATIRGSTFPALCMQLSLTNSFSLFVRLQRAQPQDVHLLRFAFYLSVCMNDANTWQYTVPYAPHNFEVALCSLLRG
jgi:hypothetical protein